MKSARPFYHYTFPVDGTILDVNLACYTSVDTWGAADPSFVAAYSVGDRIIAVSGRDRPFIQIQNQAVWTGSPDIPAREKLEFRHGVRAGEVLTLELPGLSLIGNDAQTTLYALISWIEGYTPREDVIMELPWLTLPQKQSHGQVGMEIGGLVRAYSIAGRVDGDLENNVTVNAAWGNAELAGTQYHYGVLVRAKPLIQDYTPAILFSQAVEKIQRPHVWVDRLVLEAYDPFFVLSQVPEPFRQAYLSMQLVVDKSAAARRYAA